jgi:predicted TIM-barrel fold metal-dependent hydrolase
MSNRVMVVSSDCHAGIPTAGYRQYMDPRYHSDFEDYERSLEAWGPGRVEPFPLDVTEEREKVAGRCDFMNSSGRLRDLEANGTVAEVVFPGATPSTHAPWTDFLANMGFRARTPRTRELQWAGEQAYNRWLADFCGDAPNRRVGLVFVPLHDVEAAIREIYWAAEAGLGGILFPQFNYDLPEYCHGWYWDPVWAACAESGLSLNCHGGHGTPDIGGYFSMVHFEVPFFCRRPLWHLIFSGVFDRFPALRFAITESSALWVPETMADLDDIYHRLSSGQKMGVPITVENLPGKLPSYYWRDNCYVGVSLVKISEMEARREIGVSTMMYGIDYPHPEGTWGQATTWMQASLGRAEATEEEARAMLGENAARLYHLDVEALASAVERCGPTIDEVLVRPTDEDVRDLLDATAAQGREHANRRYKGSDFTRD